METIQMIEIKDTKTVDQVIFLTTDQTIKDQVITTTKEITRYLTKQKLKF